MDVDSSWLQSLIGKRILVGLTFVAESGEVTNRAQFHGTIRAATPKGVVVQRADGKSDFTLPPSQEFIEPAAPGQYRLRSTGEVIEDPDFVCAMRMVTQGNTEASSTESEG
jgi:hypothetical protein